MMDAELEKKRKKKKLKLKTNVGSENPDCNAASEMPDLETTVASTKKSKRKKKNMDSPPKEQMAPHVDMIISHDGDESEDDPNEPTMAEKLASLDLEDSSKRVAYENKEHEPALPPSAVSIIVPLKQALRAEDHALLLDCVYTQDEKVIANSISLLNISDALKLLHFLISHVQSRGAILACIIPWLKRLLLQHATGITSHESSLHTLNSLYQLIDSRVSTFQSALHLSTCLGSLVSKVDEFEEVEKITPAIMYDESEEDE